MDSRTLTQHERNALREFEATYEHWRQATDAWLAAEVLLWGEALGSANPHAVSRLGAEATRLREVARAAYLRVLDALMQSRPD